MPATNNFDAAAGGSEFSSGMEPGAGPSAPELAAPPPIELVDSGAEDGFCASSGAFEASAAEGAILSFQLAGATAVEASFHGISYDQVASGGYGSLYLNGSSGRYHFQPAPDSSLNALSSSGSEGFLVHVSDGIASASTVLEVTFSGSAEGPRQFLVASEGVALLGDGARALWQQALSRASRSLDSLPLHPEREAILAGAFGGAGSDPALVESRREAVLALLGGSGLGVTVELRSGADLNGAVAAYAASGPDGRERIYVNADLLNAGQLDLSQLTRVLLEEAGHALDSRLNPGLDSPGDEGERFAALLTGTTLTADQWALINSEDDSATLTIDGQVVEVEESGGSSGVGRVLYLSTDGTDNDGSGSLDLSDPVSTSDTSTSTSAAITPASSTTGTAVTTTNADGSGYSYEIKSGQVAGQSFTIAGSGTYVPSALLLAIARETTESGASNLRIKVEIATAASGGTVLFEWSGTGATFPQNSGKDNISTRTSVTLTRLNNATLTLGTQYFIRVSSTDSFGKVYWSGSGSNLTGLLTGNTFENGSSQSSKDFEYQLNYSPITITPATTATFTQTVSFDGELVIPSGGPIHVVTHISEASGLTGDLSGVKATLSYGSGTTLVALTSPTYDGTAGTLTWTGTVASGVSLASNTSLSLVIANDKSGSSFKVNYDSSAAPSRIEFPNNAPVLDLDASNPLASSAQTTSITFAASYDVGDVVSLTVDGVTYNHTVVAGGTSAASVYNSLRGNSVGGKTLAETLSGKGVTWPAALTSNAITLTGSAGAANAFTITSLITNAGDTRPYSYAVDWRDAVGNFSASAGEFVRITINSTQYTSNWSSGGSGNDSRFDSAASGLATIINGLTTLGITSASYNSSGNTLTINSTNALAITNATSSGTYDSGATIATGTISESRVGSAPANQAAPTVSTTTTAVDGGTGFAGSFTQGAGAVAVVANSIGITDLDQSTIQSATIVLSNRLDGSAESLSVSGSLPTGITASAYNSSTGTLTLSGSATLAAYQSALQAIRYNNTAGTLNTTSRVINITVSDGSSSNVAVSTISMVAAADSTAPIATLTAATIPNTSSVTVQSSETGTAYLVNSTVTVFNLASITSAADNLWNSVAISTANTNTSLAATGLTDGTYRLYTVDAAGNLSSASSASVSIDSTSPTLAITSDKASLKAGETATITFTFSEAPTGFADGDISVSGGTLSAISGTGLTRTATFTPAANSSGTASITVAAGSYTDAAGNSGGAGTTPSLTYDTQAPTLAISSDKASLKAGETATITFTLSEESTNFAVSDVTVSGGTLSGFSGSGTSYTATFTPTANSTTNGVISVASGTFSDAAGNTNNDGADDNNSVTLTVDTLPLNSPPSLSLLSTTSFTEDAPANAVGSVVATFSTSDPDSDPVTVILSDTTYYALGTGADVGKVLLTAAGLALVNAGTDLPAFTLTPNDGSVNGTAVSVDPTVTAVNDAPLLSGASLTVQEGQTVTLFAANFSVSDPDSSSFTYTVSAVSGGIFQLSSAPGSAINSFTSAQLSAGAVQFAHNGEEAAPSFSVAVSDGTASSATVVASVSYTPVNEAPTEISLSANSIAENTVIGTGIKIGNLTITDPDASGNNNVLSLEGADAGSFQIRNGNELFFVGASPDFEAKPSYAVTVKSTDGSLVYSQAFTIAVTDVNEAPTVAAPLADQSATEDSAFSFTVPAGAFTDVDAGTTLTYSATLANGSPLPSWLSFNAATRTFSGTPLNGDVGAVSVTVTASDGSLSVSDTFAITVANSNDAPTGSLTISGTPSEGQTLSTVSTLADDDGLGTLAFQWNADGAPITGATASTYLLTQSDVGKVITVTASYTDDRGTAESVTSAATAAVANVDTVAPTFSAGASVSAAVNENVAANTVVYTAAATDSDFNPPATASSITYSLSGSDAGAFTIDSVTGVVRIKASPDFETTPSYAFSVVATDAAGNASTQAVALTINDLDEVAPTAPVLALGSGVTGGATAAEATQSSGVVTVTAEAGASVAVTFSRSGGATVTKTVTGAGATAVAVVLDAADLTALGDGSISVSAIATDAAGNSSAAGTTAFTLDTAVAAPLVALVSDTGSSATDGLTNNAALSITGLEAGAVVEYSADGTGGWNTTAPSPSQGSNTVHVRQSDSAGNVSAATAFSFSFDNVAPTPVISAIGGADSTVSGQANDNRVVGTAEANRSVSIVSGATLLGSTTADDSGNFTYTLTTANLTTLGQGSGKAITASQTDAAGNTGTSAAFNFAVDTIAPTLAITTPIAGDGFLNNAEDGSPLTISGTSSGADGRTVTVTVSDTKTAPTSYSFTPTVSGGAWSVTLSSAELKAFAEGSINVSASVSDAAGNPATQASASFIYDITPLAAPVISATNLSGTRATLVIEADPGARLNIYSNGSLLSGGANNLVSSTGRYSFTTPELADGTYSFTVTSLDQAGNESAASTAHALTLAPPALPTVTFVDTGTPPADGDLGINATLSDGITNNGVFTVGAIASGNTWQYSTNAGATWIPGSSTNSFTLLPGSYAIGAVRVRQVDPLGKVGATYANPAEIIVDVSAPTVALTAAKSSLGLVGSGDSATAETVALTFTFSKDPGDTFSAADITVSAGTISEVSGSGLIRTATYTPPIDFVGSATLTVASGRFTDLAGNINVDGGDANNSLSFSLNTLRASSAPRVSISSNNKRLKIGDTATLTFTFTQPPSDFTAADITASSGSISDLAATGDLKVWTATYTPAAGVQQAVSITVAADRFGVSGNSGAGTNASASSLNLNVDTLAPANVISVAFSADTGNSNNDLITKAPDQTVTGTVSGTLSNAVGFTDTVRVSIDNGASWRLAEVTGDARTGYSLGNVTLRGPSTILVVVEDEAGNTSSTFSRAYTYDPITFTGELVLSGYGDHGQTGNVDSTIRQASGQDNSFTLTLPNKETGASEVFQISTDAGTTWTNTTAAQSGLADGTYRYRGTVTDTAGNTATSNVWTVVVDRTAPGVPTLNLADGATGSGDPVTNQELTSGSGVLRVSAEAGATLQLSFSSTATGSTPFTKSVVAGGSTQAVLLTSAEVALLRGTASPTGSYTVTVNAWAEDRAGNVGASLTSPLTFTYSPDPITILGELRVDVLEGGDGSEAGEKPSIFTISRSGVTSSTPAVIVTYRLSGSAIAGVDYTYPTGYNSSTGIGTVTIGAGQATAAVSIPTIDNANQDGLRQIRLDIQPTMGYTSSGLTAFDIASLTDNDAPVVPELSVANVSVVEGNDGSKTVTFTMRLSQPTTVPVSANYSFRGGTATMGPSSSSGSDFNPSGASSGTLTFAATVSQVNLSAVVHGDSTVETDETFFLDLSAASGLTFLGGGSTLSATATIVNDDSAAAVDPNQGLTITARGDFSGTERNDTLTGDDGVNRINGLGGNDRITGGLGADGLTSGSGIDQFLYRSFAESSLAFGVDSTDAAFTSGDRIGLPTRPSSLSNVGVITAGSLTQAFALAQADIDPLTNGAQALQHGHAVMFTWGSTTRSRRTYLGVADANTGSVTNDFLVGNGLYQFSIGSLDVQAFFL